MDKNEQAIYIMKVIESCIDPVQLIACSGLIANFTLIHLDKSISELLFEVKERKMEKLNEF
jgi:hypothetical protein